MLRWIIPLACVAALAARSPAQEPGRGGWKAGAAKVNITPKVLMWMSGYGARTRPAEGKLHDLWAKALALEDPAGRRAVLVTMDLVGIDRALSVEVCRELKQKHGRPREAVVLSVSHAHTGPVVRSNLGVMYDLDEKQKQYVADYAKELHANLIRVAGEALGRLEPAEVSWGTGR